MAERDTFKYHLKDGKTIIHRGITNDLDRRENEHQGQFPKTQIQQVGRRVSREAGLKWERDGGKRPYKK